ncbi:BTAD domain-containing putative transcriptional regulator [Streptomyces sp. NPDC050560]|uniref:AfsR/SARP family transcriptional regulator n=1 Tax=Streptomyces sp. NPDC050560 TaxID=3365630 RepID=UPI0037B15871
MEIGTLGPLVVRIDGTSIVPSAAKPRQLLALLAVSPGREVTMSAITEELWDAEPPSGPVGVVQTYVKQLRRSITTALGPAHGTDAKALLRRGYYGYALDLPGAPCEARRFEDLTARGLRALGEGGPEGDEEASRLLTRALATWRGDALAGIRAGRPLRAEALRLEETRSAALEGRITADLRLGRHASVVGELAALAERFPLQENLHAQLMLALYRCGRPFHALETFRRLRRSCVEELGIEPSAPLQRLHRAVLCGDPSLEAPAREGGTLHLAAF